MQQKLKYNIIFLGMSVVLAGCGTNNNSPSKTVIPQKEILSIFSTRPTATEWFKSGTWETAQSIDGEISPSSKESSDINPSNNSVVILGEAASPAQIIAQGQDFHQNLKILKLTENAQNTLTIDGKGNSDFRVEYLELNAGKIIVKEGTLFLDSGKLGSGTTIYGATENSVQFQRFPNATTGEHPFEMTGGKFDMDISIPTGFTLSGYGEISGTLTNTDKGTLLLNNIGTLKVKSFINRGTIRVNLSNKSFTSPLLISENIIRLSGKLEVVGGVGKTYTLFKGSEITGTLSHPSYVTVSQTANEYKVTVDKIFSHKISHLTSKLFSKSRPFLHNSLATLHLSSLQNNMDFIYDANKTHIRDGLSVLIKMQDRYKFIALDQSYTKTKLGLYGGYQDDKMDIGAYQISSLGNFKITNSIHLEDNSSELTPEINETLKSRFITLKTELGLNLKLENINFIPKVFAGYHRIFFVDKGENEELFDLNMSSQGGFLSGIGLDITSKFKVNTINYEAFGSFNFTNPLNSRNFNLVDAQNNISLGFKAELDTHSYAYGSIKSTFPIQEKSTNAIELGINMKI